jgi:ribose transport system substrate-binding protein
MADWVIAQSNGTGHALIIGEPLTPASAGIVASMRSEFKTRCPKCTVSFTQVPFTEWGTKLLPTTQTALTSDPSINYVLPIYDSMMQFVGPAISAAGRINSVKVVSADGTPFVVQGLAKGQPPNLEMDVAENPERTGYAVMDQVFRILTKTKPTPNSAVVVQNLTKATAANAFSDTSWKQGFTKLWSGQ